MGFSRPENWKKTTIYFVVPSVSCLTTSLVGAILLNLLKVNSCNEALTLGLLNGIGIATAVTLQMQLFRQ